MVNVEQRGNSKGTKESENPINQRNVGTSRDFPDSFQYLDVEQSQQQQHPNRHHKEVVRCMNYLRRRVKTNYLKF